MQRLGFLLAWLLLTASGAAAFGSLTIDDFETASFDHSTTIITVTDTLSIPGVGHAIDDERRVLLTPLGGTITATLDAGSESDDKVYVTLESDGVFSSSYDWGYPRDLTAGGFNDRIEIEMDQVVPGGSVRVFLSDDDPQFEGQVEIRTVTVPGIVTIPLSDFTIEDPTRVTSMSVQCWGNGHPGTFALAHARITRASAFIPLYIREWVDMQWPPIPGGPPVEFSQIEATGLGQYLCRMRLLDWVAPETVLQAEWQAVPYYGGEIGNMAFLYGGPEQFQTTARFSLQFLQASILEPSLPAEPLVETNDLGFAISFPIVMIDPAGNVHSNSLTQIQFDAGARQSLQFSNVAVDLQASRGSPTAEMFVTFDLETTDPVEFDLPLIEMTWVGDLAPGPVPTAAAALEQPHGELALHAWPSVTRGATQFRLSRPLEQASRIQVFDVAGRIVQSLEVPAGDRAVSWDGRTHDGTVAAAGVYFARVSPGAEAFARLVRIR